MNKYAVVAVLGACALSLAGCNRYRDAEGAGGEVLARVGDQTVTSSELDAEFRAAKMTPEAQKDPATIKRLLNELVLRKYLVQQALKSDVDREPGVASDIHRGREQVLAGAYLNQALGNRPVTMADIETYIAANSAKFDGRVLLTLDEVAFAPGPELAAVTSANKNASSLDEIDKNLTLLGLAHRRAVNVVSVGEIPADLATALRAHKSAPLFVHLGDSAMYAKLLDEQATPLSGKAAEEHARQELKANAMKGEIASASAAAEQEVKYQGAYAAMMRPAAKPPAGSGKTP